MTAGDISIIRIMYPWPHQKVQIDWMPIIYREQDGESGRCADPYKHTEANVKKRLTSKTLQRPVWPMGSFHC